MNTFDFKLIPIPSRMQSLPKDKRGYPIPYNVFIAQGELVFSVNSHDATWDCADNKLCTICGCELQDNTWLIGGPLSAFHPEGAFLDLPIHKECGLYALQVCPYLAIPAYSNLKDAEALGHKFGFIAETLTAQNTKAPFFVFAKVSDWKVIPDPFIISPKKPYLEVEYWWERKQITAQEAVKLYEAQGEQRVTFVNHN